MGLVTDILHAVQPFALIVAIAMALAGVLVY
jgi:hypothetical protein